MIGKGIEEIKKLTKLNLSSHSFPDPLLRIVSSDGSFIEKPCEKIKVGDIIKIHHNERVPADLVLLYTSERSGSIFIRTDQLDGETDWKLRRPIPLT